MSFKPLAAAAAAALMLLLPQGCRPSEADRDSQVFLPMDVDGSGLIGTNDQLPSIMQDVYTKSIPEDVYGGER
ncbi:hypothetical protein KIH86_18990 [Paenibacillus sp. HN-1]|uniref:hypothetical protein n=1 Tax=Paenibacillus TaxID=44249 RepID=UPI001CA8F2CD|nr:MULTISPECIES: hypothetical protein [Paenibacillus]MBY9082343.1 hypothetical protein [Paenibacillus sp. CGMCC 1.18879]MBY9086293.1 hypothetical protein [Paenibacillus sinensis]